MASPIAHDGAFSIYAHDLKAYAADSKRSLADRILRKRHLTRTGIKYYWNRIIGRTTLPNSTVYRHLQNSNGDNRRPPLEHKEMACDA